MDHHSISALFARLLCSYHSTHSDGVIPSMSVCFDDAWKTCQEMLARYEDASIIRAVPDGSAPYFVDILLHLLRGKYGNGHISARLARLMLKTAAIAACLPPSLFISGVLISDATLIYGGGFADIYQGSYEGQLVAVRCLRFFSNNSRKRKAELQQVLYREALLWRILNHPRLLQLFGIDRHAREPLPCMISPWMEQGNIVQYIDHYQPPRSTIFRLLCEVAEGLEFIHDQHLVHGDLRGANILVSDSHEAVIADFGLSRVIDITQSTSRHNGAVRWMAPELHNTTLTEGADRRAIDIYSFAMLWIEAWTELPPFSSLNKEGQVIFAVMGGKRPDRPRHDTYGLLTDCLWELVQACWNQEPYFRPTARDIHAWLQCYINRDTLLFQPMFSQNFGPMSTSHPSQTLLKSSALPPLPVRSTSFSGYYYVSKIGDKLWGPCYSDVQVKRGNATLFTSQKVRVTLLRATRSTKSNYKTSDREIDLWSRIRHPNVAVPIGFAHWNAQVYTVTLCTMNGTALDYLTSHPDASRTEFIIGVVSGLEYLHQQDVVHGDLRGANILVSDSGVPLLSGLRFGYREKQMQQGAILANARWLPPEILCSASAQTNRIHANSASTDIWSFGMVCLELITGQPPFWDIPRESSVVQYILDGKLPDKPEVFEGEIGSKLWNLVSACWNTDPVGRTPVSSFKSGLTHLHYCQDSGDTFVFMDVLNSEDEPSCKEDISVMSWTPRPWTTARLTKPSLALSVRRRASF